MGDEAHPWDRQDREPNLWYQRFERFKLAGPTRSLLEIYNAERVAKSRGESPQAPGSWRDASKAWRWHERAEAWDKHLSDLASARVEAEWAGQIMGRTEILGRLSQQGRAKINNFFRFNSAGKITGFDMEYLEQFGHLVKKIGVKDTLYGTEYTLELYDGQTALVKMGQHEKLFVDVQEHQGQIKTVEMTLAEWQAAQAKSRQAAAETLAAFGEEIEDDE